MIPDPLPPGVYWYLPAQCLIKCLGCGLPLYLSAGYWHKRETARGPRWQVVCGRCRGKGDRAVRRTLEER